MSCSSSSTLLSCSETTVNWTIVPEWIHEYLTSCWDYLLQSQHGVRVTETSNAGGVP